MATLTVGSVECFNGRKISTSCGLSSEVIVAVFTMFASTPPGGKKCGSRVGCDDLFQSGGGPHDSLKSGQPEGAKTQPFLFHSIRGTLRMSTYCYQGGSVCLCPCGRRTRSQDALNRDRDASGCASIPRRPQPRPQPRPAVRQPCADCRHKHVIVIRWKWSCGAVEACGL